MKLPDRKKVIKLIIIVLAAVAVFLIDRIIIGNTFTIRVDCTLDTHTSAQIIYEEQGILETVSQRFEGDTFVAEIRGVKPGKTLTGIIINGDGGSNQIIYRNYYVHKSGLITQDTFIGTCNRFYIIGIELILLLLILLVRTVIACVKIGRENMYSYKLVGNMGVALFLFLCFALFTAISLRQGIAYYRLDILLEVFVIIFKLFAYLAVPGIVLLSVFLMVSNIVLIIREGKRLSNILGILLGLFLLALTFSADFIKTLFYGLEIHNKQINYNAGQFFDVFFGALPVYLECLMVSTLFCSLKAHRHVPKFDKDYIIILGCSVKKDGTLTKLLKGRADRALWFAEEQKKATGKEIIFVPSGGQGSDEVIAEAEAIKNYLVSQGVSEDRILVENKSTNTRENMDFSRKMIEAHGKDAKVAFSTTGYHVFRSGNIARSMDFHADGVGSKTKWYFYVNALIREFIANLSADRKRHIINIVGLFVYSIVVMLLNNLIIY